MDLAKERADGREHPLHNQFMNEGFVHVGDSCAPNHE